MVKRVLIPLVIAAVLLAASLAGGWLLLRPDPAPAAADAAPAAHTARPTPTSTPAPTLTPAPAPTSQPPPTPQPSMTLTPTPEQPVQVTLAAVGDIMLGRKVNLKMVEYADYTWPFHDVAPLIREADLAVGNLESMFYDRCEPTAERMVFCADPAALEGLVYAGFDGLSLANNHHLDYGEDAFRQTVALLEEGGITPFYHDEVMIAEVRGVRIGVIGLDDKLEWLKPEEIAPLIEAAAAQVDVLVGFMHWGQEYWSEADLRQQYLAPALVEAGMDVVIGSHPHVVQPVVIYGDAPVFLSLGNFVFDQRQPEAARRGDILLLTLTVEDGELAGIDYELIPVMIHDYGQPRLTEGE